MLVFNRNQNFTASQIPPNKVIGRLSPPMHSLTPIQSSFLTPDNRPFSEVRINMASAPRNGKSIGNIAVSIQQSP